MVSKPHSGLLLDMGLGKTSITLGAIRAAQLKRVLLIAPIRTLYTVWPEEIRKWDDFNELTYYNWHEGRCAIEDLPNVDIVGINPESVLGLLHRKEFVGVGWDAIVIDESHTFKNPSSQRFKYLKKILHHFPRRHILTGTVAPNGLEDLWAQVYILDRGQALAPYITHFRNTYCTPAWNGFDYDIIPGKVSMLYDRIKGLVMRLSAADHLDMPELVVNPITVKLSPAARKVYKEMEDDFITLLGEGEAITAPNAAVAGGKCRQIANGGIYQTDHSVVHIHDEKVNALKELVEGMNGNPILVFYEFRHDVERIYKVLGKVPNLTGAKDPLSMVNDFNAGKIPVMVGHGATVGVGLNLQAKCHNVCWMGVPWDLGMHDQANARVYRQGQEADRVFIHYIMAEDTMDQKVLKALAKKGRVQEDLYSAIQSK